MFLALFVLLYFWFTSYFITSQHVSSQSTKKRWNQSFWCAGKYLEQSEMWIKVRNRVRKWVANRKLEGHLYTFVLFLKKGTHWDFKMGRRAWFQPFFDLKPRKKLKGLCTLKLLCSRFCHTPFNCALNFRPKTDYKPQVYSIRQKFQLKWIIYEFT